MPNPPRPEIPLAQRLQAIDSRLPALPREQQNLVAAYARGLADGLALRRSGVRAQPPTHRRTRGGG